MLIFTGKYTEAKVFTDTLDEASEKQIKQILDNPAFEESQVRVMPDVHAGAGCAIGFTATIDRDNPKIVPNIAGVDIGCGVFSVECSQMVDKLPMAEIDKRIHERVPSGFSIFEDVPEFLDRYNKYQLSFYTEYVREELEPVWNLLKDDKIERDLKSLGTLGGGNHFMEISECVSEHDGYRMQIHSGSRNFGYRIAEYFQKLAKKQHEDLGRENYPGWKEAAYLEGELAEKYLECMDIAQRYALMNRRIIAQNILGEEYSCGCAYPCGLDTVHNYVDMKSGIIRNGAVSAKENEYFVLPINMEHGTYLAKGRGTPDWNYSAPHGAGRLLGRKQAKKALSMDEFKESMEGIYTTCLSKDTLDESPMAYKDAKSILQHMGPCAEILELLTPIYNFKAK